jgi:hypothetical protein
VTVVRIGGDESPWTEDPETAATEPEGQPGPLALGSLVLVTWRDAWFDFDQPDAEDARSDYLVTTVGFLVGHGPRFVSIAQEILPDGDGFRAITHVPLSVVETMAPLHRPDEQEMRDQAAT